MPDPSPIIIPPAGVQLLRTALGQIQSAIAAVVSELDHVTPERWQGALIRTRRLAALAQDAAAIADESLLAVAGGAPPIPDLDPEDAAKGTGRFRRPEPGDDTEPGASW